MIEDITATDLSKESVIFSEENHLKFTCNECNFVTINQMKIDNHVKSKHEEVKFECTICKHEFSEIEDYDDSHIKEHEIQSDTDVETKELENIVFSYILVAFAEETSVKHALQKDTIEPQQEPTLVFTCKQCEFQTDNDKNLNTHIKTKHQPTKGNSSKVATKIKCPLCIYQCLLDVQMRKHMEQKHKENRILDFLCDLCEFKTNNDKSLKTHMQTEHQSAKASNPKTSSKVKCDMCI